MTQARKIIKDAYRENNLIAIGVDPTEAEFEEALDRLQNICDSLFGDVLGIYLQDWQVPPRRTSPVNARWPMRPAPTELPDNVWPYPPQNVRILASQDQPQTIYLTPQPNDGAQIQVVGTGADFSTNPLTIDANGLRFADGSGQLVLDAPLTEPLRLFYRADLGRWIVLETITLDSESFLPREFDDYFITALNIRLCPRFSKDPRDSTVAVFGAKEQKIKTRYRQVEPVPGAAHPTNTYAGDNGEFWYDENRLYGQ